MKRLLQSFFTVICFVAVCISSEIVSPELVVRNAIKAAHANDFKVLSEICDFEKIGKFPRHSQSKREFISLLQGIEESKLKFQVSRGKQKKMILCRMLEPRSLDFVLELCPPKENYQASSWVITGVHP